MNKANSGNTTRLWGKNSVTLNRAIPEDTVGK